MATSSRRPRKGWLLADGITVANKATAIYATYLEKKEKTRLDLFMQVAERAQAQAQAEPQNANAWYWNATRWAATARHQVARPWRKGWGQDQGVARKAIAWRPSMPTRALRWAPSTPR
jgi:hypothetical protein